VVYLSTIGVYGDHGGAWIDETAPLNAGNPRGRRRIEAEAAWLARGERLGSPVQVLRLAGIYGPGRSAVDDLRAGVARRLIKPGQVFNRIHVDDIAAAVMAALAHPEATGAFNICDDEPAPPQDVVEYAARRLGLPVPPDLSFEQAQLSEMARSFYAECKRCRNHRARRALGWRPQYPSYREGLDAIIAAP
jgi:nucleoside-diphosphate-sugar epimerase